jgi:hypothetical protein
MNSWVRNSWVLMAMSIPKIHEWVLIGITASTRTTEHTYGWLLCSESDRNIFLWPSDRKKYSMAQHLPNKGPALDWYKDDSKGRLCSCRRLPIFPQGSMSSKHFLGVDKDLHLYELLYSWWADFLESSELDSRINVRLLVRKSQSQHPHPNLTHHINIIIIRF